MACFVETTLEIMILRQEKPILRPLIGFAESFEFFWVENGLLAVARAHLTANKSLDFQQTLSMALVMGFSRLKS
jgi:hypothetical protein